MIALLVGVIVLQLLLNSNQEAEEKQRIDRLNRVHSETVLKIKTGINVYSTVVSSLRAYIENSENFPEEIQMQAYLQDLIKDIDFKDSIIVSWVDTNQIFQYTVTPYEIDPFKLKGTNVGTLRPHFEIEKLNKLMLEDNISLFDPINLMEGWAAFPFNFSARNKDNKVMGYIAPVLNVKYLLDYSYKEGSDSNFVHSFTLRDTVNFTREVVYDGTAIHSAKRDDQYFKNFKAKSKDFVYSNVDFFGLKIKIGSAYKMERHKNNKLAIITYLWFCLLCLVCIVTLIQFFRYNKLNLKLALAHHEIAVKNQQLEGSLSNVQILIKEIHHRVKNNMQIISSLLNLQINEQTDKKVIIAIDEIKGRIKSMSLVHQKLYGTDDLTNINVKGYVEQLISFIDSTMGKPGIFISNSIQIPDNLSFNMDSMMPLGLIMNELATNSYKYAFDKKKKGLLNISISKKGDDFILSFSDNGPGIPDDKLVERKTLGIDLIYGLSEQLLGSVEYSNEDLSTFTIRFQLI